MAKPTHLFIIDPIVETTLAIDTSMQIAFALHCQGAEIHCAYLQDLFSSTVSGAQCRGRRIDFAAKTHMSVQVAGEITTRALSTFNAVHMRKNPPFDMAYIAATWHLDHAGTHVFNRPQSLRDYNEKMAILNFPAATVQSLVSNDCEQILAFIATELQGNAIVKPLTMFGGEGVFRVQLDKRGETAARLRVSRALQQQGTALIVQQFREEVLDGEVRAFCAFGEAVAWCLKKPAPGNFLANTARGAKLLPHSPSATETKNATTVAQQLLKDGVYFIGFDMIAGLITEINITSPRLLLAPASDADPYQQIAAKIAASCH